MFAFLLPLILPKKHTWRCAKKKRKKKKRKTWHVKSTHRSGVAWRRVRWFDHYLTYIYGKAFLTYHLLNLVLLRTTLFFFSLFPFSISISLSLISNSSFYLSSYFVFARVVVYLCVCACSFSSTTVFKIQILCLT